MKYLVTGAAGFIGSRFVASCNESNIEVISADFMEQFENRHPDVIFEDIVDIFDLPARLWNRQCDIDAIVHMGAVADTTCRDSAHLEQMNVNYSRTLWAYAAQYNIPFVYASSAATYGQGSNFSDDEARIEELKPLNEYGLSKHKFDMVALSAEAAGCKPAKWAGLKLFNVYGYGEQYKGNMASMVCKAISQIKDRGVVTLFRSHIEGIPDGHQKRDFVHVDDVINVIHWCLTNSKRGIYNVGTGKARTFLDLVHAVFREMNIPPVVEWQDTPTNIIDQYQYFTQAAIGKLRSIGYAQDFLTIEQGIKKYVRRSLCESS